MSEKTEAPTDQRLAQARKKGQIAKTTELTALLQLGSVFAFFLMQGKSLWEDIQEFILVTIQILTYPTVSAMDVLSHAMMTLFKRRVFILFAMVCVATVISSLVQTGIIFAFGALVPSFSRLDPINNLKNFFSLKRCLELLKSILKLLLVAFVFYYVLRRYVMTFQFLPHAGLDAAIAVTITIIFWLWSSLLGCYLVFSLGDYTFQRYLLMQQLKMTKEEVKQEYKDNEGSPEIKSRQKEVQQEIQSGSLDSNIKKSSVIIRNPVRLAIGLFYEAGKTPLPIITEMGQGAKARRIIEIAKQAQIPMVENVDLARKLFKEGKQSHPIPNSLFVPVAAILRLILRKLPPGAASDVPAANSGKK